jgi:hypothetical protein
MEMPVALRFPYITGIPVLVCFRMRHPAEQRNSQMACSVELMRHMEMVVLAEVALPVSTEVLAAVDIPAAEQMVDMDLVVAVHLSTPV